MLWKHKAESRFCTKHFADPVGSGTFENCFALAVFEAGAHASGQKFLNDLPLAGFGQLRTGATLAAILDGEMEWS